MRLVPLELLLGHGGNPSDLVVGGGEGNRKTGSATRRGRGRRSLPGPKRGSAGSCRTAWSRRLDPECASAARSSSRTYQTAGRGRGRSGCCHALSEERCVGKECVITRRSRWSPLL